MSKESSEIDNARVTQRYLLTLQGQHCVDFLPRKS